MTKNYTLTFLLFLLFLTASAQDKKWHLEAHYPVSIGNTFNSDERGLMDFGIGYRFLSAGNVNLGISFNYTRFADELPDRNDPLGLREVKFTDQFFQPRLFAEFALPPNKKLVMGAGIGYTFLRSQGQLFFNEEGRIDGIENSGGFNFNVQASYNITSHWYLNIQYDLILIDSEVNPDDQISILKFGGGIRF